MPQFSSKAKRAAGLLLATATLVALAGCATSTPSSNSTAHETGTINFVTYTGGAAGQKYVNAIKSFEKVNPGIKVNMQVIPGDATYDTVIKSRIEGGTSPDIFEIDGAMPGELPYVKAGLLTDLSGQPWVKQLTPSIAAAKVSTNNKTYSFVTQESSVGVFYNKAIFKANGITVPTDWAEFTSDIQKLKSANIVPLAVGAKDGWPLAIQAEAMAANLPAFAKSGNKVNNALLAGTTSFSSSPQWKKVITDFASLVKSGAYDAQASGITWPSSATDFASGKDAMLIQGDFAVPAVRTANTKFDMGYFPLPYVGKGGTPAVGVSYQGMLSIPKKAPHVALAEKFLDYLATPSVMTKYLSTAVALPTIQGVHPTVDPAVKQILPALAKKSVDISQVGLSTAVGNALTAGLQSIIAGNGSVSATLAAMDQAQQQ